MRWAVAVSSFLCCLFMFWMGTIYSALGAAESRITVERSRDAAPLPRDRKIRALIECLTETEDFACCGNGDALDVGGHAIITDPYDIDHDHHPRGFNPAGGD